MLFSVEIADGRLVQSHFHLTRLAWSKEYLSEALEFLYRTLDSAFRSADINLHDLSTGHRAGVLHRNSDGQALFD